MADEVKKIPVVSQTGTTAPAQSATQSDNGDDPFANIKGELFSRFELLPDDIKKAIVDDGYQKKLFDIAKEMKMTYEELGTMETETTMVLLGMTRPEDFRDELQLELKKNDAEIDPLVAKINEQVFAPIRASLERVYAAKKDPIDYLEEAVAKTAPVAGVPNPTTATPTTPAMNPNLSKQDASVLAKSGVVISETPKTPMQTSVMSPRNDILKGIENPQKTPVSSIVADKLKTAGPVMPTKMTDYSVGKTTPPAGGIQNPGIRTSSDPYREPIS